MCSLNQLVVQNTGLKRGKKQSARDMHQHQSAAYAAKRERWSYCTVLPINHQNCFATLTEVHEHVEHAGCGSDLSFQLQFVLKKLILFIKKSF